MGLGVGSLEAQVMQLLASAGLIDGKRVTCYEHVRVDAETCGATWLRQDSVRDGRIVTAPTWQEHAAFYRDVFACLHESVPA